MLSKLWGQNLVQNQDDWTNINTKCHAKCTSFMRTYQNRGGGGGGLREPLKLIMLNYSIFK